MIKRVRPLFAKHLLDVVKTTPFIEKIYHSFFQKDFGDDRKDIAAKFRDIFENTRTSEREKCLRSETTIAASQKNIEEALLSPLKRASKRPPVVCKIYIDEMMQAIMTATRREYKESLNADANQDFFRQTWEIGNPFHYSTFLSRQLLAFAAVSSEMGVYAAKKCLHELLPLSRYNTGAALNFLSIVSQNGLLDKNMISDFAQTNAAVAHCMIEMLLNNGTDTSPDLLTKSILALPGIADRNEATARKTINSIAETVERKPQTLKDIFLQKSARIMEELSGKSAATATHLKETTQKIQRQFSF